MKCLGAVLCVLLLSGCQATVVSYNTAHGERECYPVVQVHSFGSSVTVTDGSVCQEQKTHENR